MELFDDDAKIPYHIGEIFISQDMTKTMVNHATVYILSNHFIFSWVTNFLQNCLEEAKEKTDKDIASLEVKCAELKSVMSDLKAQLYAKFGSNINLEADDE